MHVCLHFGLLPVQIVYEFGSLLGEPVGRPRTRDSTWDSCPCKVHMLGDINQLTVQKFHMMGDINVVVVFL